MEKDYDFLSMLRDAEDVNPESHDGSYKLVQETLKTYKEYGTGDYDYHDFDLIYMMSVINTKENIIQKIGNDSQGYQIHVEPVGIKKILNVLTDVFNTPYDNVKFIGGDKQSVGMFESASYTINRNANIVDINKGAKLFMNMCIKIGTEDLICSDIFDLVDGVLKENLPNIQTAIASQILHCIRPDIFAVINAKTIDYFIEYFSISDKCKNREFYVDGLKNIAKQLNNYGITNIKNYRTIDIIATAYYENLNSRQPIEFGILSDFFKKYGGVHVDDDIKKVGTNAKKIFIEYVQRILSRFSDFRYNEKKDWQSSGTVKRYFWAQLKHKDYNAEPFSIAISMGKGINDDIYLNVKIEINDNEIKKKNSYEQYERFKRAVYRPINFAGTQYWGETKTKEDLGSNSHADVLKWLDNDNLLKVRPAICICGPYNKENSGRIIDETVKAVEAFRQNYLDIFSNKNAQQITSEARGNEMNNIPKNIILYGPPGTGKTYNTDILAALIIGGTTWSFDDVIKNNLPADAKKEAKKIIESHKEQIEFTTFHQSYGYEEFIEGIKPVVSEDENTGSDLQYKISPGIFKSFCEKAQMPDIKELNVSGLGLNSSPKIWKVSLQGTGDNSTRRECLHNEDGHIRIGFDTYEDPEEEISKNGAGKTVLNALITKMQKGDIVLSCWSATEIDAIGVVTGDYRWDNSYPDYKRVRDVHWIVRLKAAAEKINIFELNNKKALTLSSVYELDIAVEKVLDIVKRYRNQESIQTSNNKPYVFIIDEINRGNISKIFGELITLIEEDKREGKEDEAKVTLPYSQAPFSVPSNVYIIGTMNTADRSIKAIDTALRRRFHFIEMMPDEKVLKDKNEQPLNVAGINIQKMLAKINARIAALYDREHTIGHAYFTKLKENPDIGLLADIFRNKIIPLLQEYFYDDYEKIRLVIGDSAKAAKGLGEQFIERTPSDADALFGTVSEFMENEYTSYQIKNIDDGVFKNPKAYIHIYDLTANDEQN